MKRIIMILMAVALVALPTMAQTFGEDQPNSVQFQSTSTLQGSGSTYTPSPSLNADGTAYNPAVASAPTQSGPRRSKENPGEVGNIDSGSPVGDAVLPLTLMALAFAGVIYLRRRKRA